MQKFRYIALVIYILTIGLVFSFASRNAQDSTRDSNMVVDIVIDIGTTVSPSYEEHVDEIGHIKARDEISPFIRKAVGHFGLFLFLGVFAAIVYIYFPKRFWLGLLITVCSGFVIAGISECLQIIAVGRGPAFKDVLLDFGGYLSGLVIVYVIYIISHKETIQWIKN